jgi:hypothetical protein
MEWVRERDLLIAQTLAFVQSVSDKKRNAERLGSRLDTKPRIEAAPIDAIKIVEPPASMRFNPQASIQQASIQQASIQQAAIQQASIQQAAIQALRINISGDFRTEIQNRVANFRAHQQRFHREREEYCSATLAKLRAIGNDSASPPLRK